MEVHASISKLLLRPLGGLRQVNHKFEASLGTLARSCHNTFKKSWCWSSGRALAWHAEGPRSVCVPGDALRGQRPSHAVLTSRASSESAEQLRLVLEPDLVLSLSCVPLTVR